VMPWPPVCGEFVKNTAKGPNVSVRVLLSFLFLERMSTGSRRRLWCAWHPVWCRTVGSRGNRRASSRNAGRFLLGPLLKFQAPYKATILCHRCRW